jgi:hypothetical protein
VRYDLRVWQVRPDGPPRRVYERRDLTSADHRIDTPLPPGAEYYWSVRARFDDQGAAATRWGAFRKPYAAAAGLGTVRPRGGAEALAMVRDPCSLDFIPEANYYRFRTPAEE